MAITIGYNWTLISIAQLDYGRVNTYAMIREQNTLENKTKYSLMTVYELSSSYISFDSARLILDGNIRDFDYTTLYRSNNDKDPNVLMWLGDREITHETDGTSPTKNVAISWTASFGGSFSSNVDINFPKIKRQAIIKTANDFIADIENPTMTYTYYEGVDFQVNAYLEVNGTRFKTVEDIGNVGTYTFELTSQEWDNLVTLCQAPTMTVRYGVATLINSQTENAWSYLDRTMTIGSVREPGINTSFAETNTKIATWKSNHSYSNIYVYNASTIRYSGNVNIDDTTTLNNIKLIDNSSGKVLQTITGSGTGTIPYSFNPILLEEPISNYEIVVADNRTLTASTTAISLAQFVQYEKVAINSYSFKRENPTSSNIIVNGNFNYWGDINSNNDNVVAVKYKLDNGNWVTIPSTNYTIDSTNHKLTISNYIISNILNYRQKGQFSISIEDELTSQDNIGDNGLVLKGVPTFDAGEHDLKVNGTLYIADEDGDNAINVEEELNRRIVFSTNEFETNETWINNKKIYGKTFDINIPDSSGSFSINHNISITDINNVWIDQEHSFITFLSSTTGVNNYLNNSTWMFTQVNGTSINCEMGSSLSSISDKKMRLTIKYTK